MNMKTNKEKLVEMGKMFLFCILVLVAVLTACMSDSLFDLDLEWLVFVGIFVPMGLLYIMQKKWHTFNMLIDDED